MDNPQDLRYTKNHEWRVPVFGKKKLPSIRRYTSTCIAAKPLPIHPTGMTFSAFDSDGDVLLHATYYSIGGRFVVDEGRDGKHIKADDTPVRYPFQSPLNCLRTLKRTGKDNEAKCKETAHGGLR